MTRNLILQQDEWAGGRGVQCILYCIIAGQITDMGVAGTWLTSQVAMLDASAWGRVAPCCDQLLISLQYMHYFSHCCIAWDAVNGVSHITYKTVYKGSTYTLVLNFWHLFDRQGGSTYMRIDLYAHTYSTWFCYCSFSREQWKWLKIERLD